MNPESIDRIEHSTYTPLEKKYSESAVCQSGIGLFSVLWLFRFFFFVQRGLLTGMPLLSLLNAVCL